MWTKGDTVLNDGSHCSYIRQGSEAHHTRLSNNYHDESGWANCVWLGDDYYETFG